MVRKILNILAARAHFLGLALGIRPSDIETIRAQYKGPNDVLTEVLTMWLKQSYRVDKHGLPSWRTLVKAVDDPAGGCNHALAKRIASAHPGESQKNSKWFSLFECFFCFFFPTTF